MYNYPPIVPFWGRNLHVDHDGIIFRRRLFLRSIAPEAEQNAATNTDDGALLTEHC